MHDLHDLPLLSMLSLASACLFSLTTISSSHTYQVYNVWRKQYFTEVLEPKHPESNFKTPDVAKKLKAAYLKVTQEEKDAIAAELEEKEN